MEYGLCLAGGGIKCAAHIGALKAFEEENINFNYISGTSSGSIIATLYAIGYSADELYKIIKKNENKINYIEFNKILKLLFGIIFRGKIIIDGLNSGKKIEKLIDSFCKKKVISNISQIRKKLLIPSVDLNSGKVYIFSSMKNKLINRSEYSDEVEYIYNIPIGRAVRASCSYPGVFSPCDYLGNKLIDGGIRENVPWKELKLNGVDKIICVTFSKDINYKKNKNIFDVIKSSLDILCHELSTYEMEGADNIIKIKTKDVSLLDIKEFDELYNLGYTYTKQYINNKIKKEIN